MKACQALLALVPLAAPAGALGAGPGTPVDSATASSLVQPELRTLLVDGELTTTVWRAPSGEPSVLYGSSSGPCGVKDGGFLFGLGYWLPTASPPAGGAPSGSVEVEGGAATLDEGGSFLVTLSQSFCMPDGATEFTFDLTSVAFDLSSSFLPDAFEVALLDENGFPAVPTWNVSATSFYNRQESGTEHLGPLTTSDGTRIAVDLTGIPPGTSLTVVFDLVGGDFDQGSTVAFDDARAVGPCAALALTQTYGAGTAGKLGEPALSLSAPAVLGKGVELRISSSTDVLTHGCMLIGFAPLQVPSGLGADLLVDFAVLQPFDLPPGGAEFPFAVPAQSIHCGMSLYLQALIIDADAPGLLAATPGFEIVIGS